MRIDYFTLFAIHSRTGASTVERRTISVELFDGEIRLLGAAVVTVRYVDDAAGTPQRDSAAHSFGDDTCPGTGLREEIEAILTFLSREAAR